MARSIAKAPREPATFEELIDGNIFNKCTMDEIQELWDEYKFFCTNGYTREGTMLDRARAYLCSINPLGVILMEKMLLMAIAVRGMEMNDWGYTK